MAINRLDPLFSSTWALGWSAVYDRRLSSPPRRSAGHPPYRGGAVHWPKLAFLVREWWMTAGGRGGLLRAYFAPHSSHSLAQCPGHASTSSTVAFIPSCACSILWRNSAKSESSFGTCEFNNRSSSTSARRRRSTF